MFTFPYSNPLTMDILDLESGRKREGANGEAEGKMGRESDK
jgi:hypothetical protein